LITKEEIIDVVGKHRASTITDELVEGINKGIEGDADVASLIAENFVTYKNVMQDGRFSLEQYVAAIKFSSCKMMNMSNLEAYKSTYPDRYDAYKFKYVTVGKLEESEFKSRMGSYVSAVANSKLVVNILNQVQIPTKLLNMHLLQEAINVEAHLMHNAKSEMVKEKAANTLISYLGAETENQIQIDVGFKKDDIIEQYELAMKNMVEEQLVQIRKGADVKQIANAQTVEAEVID
jgi:hypothetical protein